MKTSRQEFEALVAEVLKTLPADFVHRISKVEIVVEAEPPPEIREQFSRGFLLGLYQGHTTDEREHLPPLFHAQSNLVVPTEYRAHL